VRSPGAACRRQQAAGGRRETVNSMPSKPPGACATERAPELRPFSKIILFHFMMEPRVNKIILGRSTDGGSSGLK